MICYHCNKCGNEGGFIVSQKWDSVDRKMADVQIECGNCGSTDIKTFEIK